MIKRIFLCLFLSVSVFAFSQEGTSSPYSFFGIGDIKFKGSLDARAMGTVSVIPDSIHLNLSNPAQYANLKITNYAVGINFNSNDLMTNTQSEKTKRTSLDYISVGIPTKKVTFAFGITPFSSVGYRLKDTSGEDFQYAYRGKGGVNKVFLGAGTKITKGLNFGANVEYNFGQIEATSITYINGGPLFQTKEVNTSNTSGLSLNTGLFYERKIFKKYNLYSSLVYTPEANLRLKNTRQISLVTSSEATYDTYDEETLPNSTIKLPSKFALGLGIGKSLKWAVGTEITLSNNKNFTNRFAEIESSFKNGSRIAVGGFYVPKYNAYSGFFKKVTYRAGFRFENTGLVINGKQIKDNSATVGFGLPLRGTLSNINVSVEYGSRGTVAADLIREKYFNFNFAISFNDKWFLKPKFD